MIANAEGEEVVLTEATARIVSVLPDDTQNARKTKRRAGTGKGVFIMSPDFDTPLEDFAEYSSPGCCFTCIGGLVSAAPPS